MATAMPPPPPAAHRGRRISIEVLVVLAVAGLIAVILTWPLAANFDTIIAGGGSAGDNTGYIWDLWSSSHYGIDLWGAGLQDHVGLPFGRTVIGGANLLLFFYNVPGAILGTLLPTIAAYNVMVLAGMALTGASMYLLVRWLGLGIGPAAWAGMAFEIFPYEALRVAAHPPLAWLMFAPLLLMACIWWLQKPSWRRATVMAAATLFAWLSNPYFGAMALVAVGVTLVVAIPLFAHCFGGRAVLARVGEAIGALIVIVIVPLGIIIASTRGVADQIVTRQRVELELYGAHIGDYLKPVSGQYLWSGIFGTDAAQWPLSSPGGERMAFLGWTVMALAIIGLALGWRHRGNIGLRLRAALFLTSPIAIAMAIFSLASPYSVFGHRIPMASSFVFDYLPFLRVYARFSLFVMACVLVMGAVGLALLIRGRSVTWRTSIMGIAIILTAMELPISVPIGTGVPILLNGTAPENVPTWRWLANHDPGAVVFETPAFPNETMDREFLYGQLVHGHPLANGGLTEPGAVSDFGREYGNPLFPASPATYAAAGIRYVAAGRAHDARCDDAAGRIFGGRHLPRRQRYLAGYRCPRCGIRVPRRRMDQPPDHPGSALAIHGRCRHLHRMGAARGHGDHPVSSSGLCRRQHVQTRSNRTRWHHLIVPGRRALLNHPSYCPPAGHEHVPPCGIGRTGHATQYR